MGLEIIYDIQYPVKATFARFPPVRLLFIKTFEVSKTSKVFSEDNFRKILLIHLHTNLTQSSQFLNFLVMII